MSMYQKVQEFIESHIKTIGATITITALVLWLISQFIPSVADFLIQRNLLDVFVVVFLVDIVTRLVEIKLNSTVGQTKVYPDQRACYEDLISFVKDRRPHQASLLEYSSFTISGLLETLRDNNCEIRLLLKHPGEPQEDLQKRRIRARIEDLCYVTFENYDKIEIRCYRIPCSLRGRNLGNTLLNLGWYTYTYRKGELGVYGHGNPMINVYTSSVEGGYLQEMFNRTFDLIWNAETTIAVEEVLESYEE